MNKRRKEQLEVRRVLRKFNKQLKEDKFAGRFEVKQVGRKDIAVNNYTINYRKNMTIDEVGDPEWHINWYKIDLIDHEDGRVAHFECRWSKTFGLIELIALDEESCKYRPRGGGLSHLTDAINEFIIQSDFDEKWKSLEYAKTHWYSGDELKQTMKWLGPNWESAEKLAAAEPNRFTL